MAEHDTNIVRDTMLCVGCGLCCNGTLYSRARVSPGEQERITSHGLTLVTVKGETFFRQPCHLEADGRCTIYESRFEKCRSFRCQLLRDYQSGQVGADEAKRRVRTALQLAAAVKSDDPAAANALERCSIRARLVEAPENESPAEGRERMRRLLNIIVLDDYLERWFRLPPKGSPDQDAETSISNR